MARPVARPRPAACAWHCTDRHDWPTRTLVQLWQLAGLDDPLATLAVGGYGRAEFFPQSDVDVLLLLLPDGSSPSPMPQLKARLERFIGNCWDVGWRSAPACAASASA